MRLLIVVGLTALSAACYVAIKAGLAFAPPLLFAALRALIAGSSLLGLLLVLRRPPLPPRRCWRWIAPLALTATAVAYGAMFVSPNLAGAGIASVLGNSQPLFAIGLGALLLGEPITRGKGLALVFGLAGIVLIALPALTGGNALGLSGALFALAAAGGFAVGSVLVKRMAPGPDLLSITTWQFLLGALPLLAVGWVGERGRPIVWNVEFVALLLFLAVPGTAGLTAAWYWLVQWGDLGRLTTFFFLVPVFGLALAALAFGERIAPVQGVGVVLILVATAFTLGDERRGDADLPSATGESPPPVREGDRDRYDPPVNGGRFAGGDGGEGGREPPKAVGEAGEGRCATT